MGGIWHPRPNSRQATRPRPTNLAALRARTLTSLLQAKENRPGHAPGPVILRAWPLRDRARAPEAAEAAEAAEPDTLPSPGSPSHPGTSASPEAAAEVAAEAEAAEAAEVRRSCRSGSRASCASETALRRWRAPCRSQSGTNRSTEDARH